MRNNNSWIKYVLYFIVGFLIFTVVSTIMQLDLLKSLNIDIDINVKNVIVHSIHSGLVLYIILYFLIFIINMLYNIRLIKRLNMESEKIRKSDSEKILKERREISMKRKVLIVVLIIVLVFLTIFAINVVRKGIILQKYSDAVESRRSCSNYYVKCVNDKDVVYEFYRKRNIKMVRSTLDNGTVHMLYQEDDKDYYILIQAASGEKVGFKSSVSSVPIFDGGDNYFSTFYEGNPNWFDTLKFILDTDITTEVFNGKECYKLYAGEFLQAYVDKDNLMALKTVHDQIFEYMVCSFGSVPDESIEMPDLKEFTIKDEVVELPDFDE